MSDDVIAERDGMMVLTHEQHQDGYPIVVMGHDRDDAEPFVLGADDLRWLVYVGGPAALIAIGAQPKLSGPAFRDPPTPPDEHATNVQRPLAPPANPHGTFTIDPGTDDDEAPPSAGGTTDDGAQGTLPASEQPDA